MGQSRSFEKGVGEFSILTRRPHGVRETRPAKHSVELTNLLLCFTFLPFIGLVFYFSVVNGSSWRANGCAGNPFRSIPRLPGRMGRGVCSRADGMFRAAPCLPGRMGSSMRSRVDRVFGATPCLMDNMCAVRTFGFIGLGVTGGLAHATNWHREEENDSDDIL
jgi:hypothetical protein